MILSVEDLLIDARRITQAGVKLDLNLLAWHSMTGMSINWCWILDVGIGYCGIHDVLF